MKNECGQTESSEVERERSSSALFEENKKPDEQIDESYEIDIKLSRCPLVN
jgi:hypothetical protein